MVSKAVVIRTIETLCPFEIVIERRWAGRDPALATDKDGDPALTSGRLALVASENLAFGTEAFLGDVWRGSITLGGVGGGILFSESAATCPFAGTPSGGGGGEGIGSSADIVPFTCSSR